MEYKLDTVKEEVEVTGQEEVDLTSGAGAARELPRTFCAAWKEFFDDLTLPDFKDADFDANLHKVRLSMFTLSNIFGATENSSGGQRNSEYTNTIKAYELEGTVERIRFTLFTLEEELEKILDYYVRLFSRCINKLSIESRGEEKMEESEYYQITKVALSTIVNLASLCERGRHKIMEHKELMKQLQEFWFNRDIHQDTSVLILRNLSRYPKDCELLLAEIPNIVKDVINLITSKPNGSHLDDYTNVILNLAVVPATQKMLLENNQCLLLKVLPLMKAESLPTTTRLNIAKMLKNCLLGEEIPKLEDKDSELLHFILWPLVDGYEYTEEDNDKFPLDLQYLPSTKLRESDVEFRETMVACLVLLSNRKKNRDVLRESNSYVFIRELHKAECSSDTNDMIEMLVANVYLADE